MNAAETYRARLAEVRDLIRRARRVARDPRAAAERAAGRLGLRGRPRPHRRAPPGDHAEPHRPPVRVEAPDDLRRVRDLSACPTGGCVCRDHAPESGFDPSECLDLADGMPADAD